MKRSPALLVAVALLAGTAAAAAIAGNAAAAIGDALTRLADEIERRRAS